MYGIEYIFGWWYAYNYDNSGAKRYWFQSLDRADCEGWVARNDCNHVVAEWKGVVGLCPQCGQIVQQQIGQEATR